MGPELQELPVEFFGVLGLRAIQQRTAKLPVCFRGLSIGCFPFLQALLKIVDSVGHTSDVNQ